MFTESFETERGTEHHRELTGLTELVDIAKIADNSSGRDRESRSSVNGDEGFTHTASIGEAIDLAEHGWKEGVEQVKAMLAEVDLDDAMLNLGNTVEYQYDTAGDEPEIDRYIAGEPENMIEFYIDPSTQGRNLELAINASQHAYVDPAAITRRGVAVAIALEMVTAQGYGVQLDMVERCSSSNYSDTVVGYKIPVIKAGDFYNLDSLSFSLMHPSFLRRLIFALNENEPESIREDMGYHDMGGYGRPEYIPTEGEGKPRVVIDKDEGLLRSDIEIPQYAAEIAKRLLKTANPDIINVNSEVL